MKRHTRLLNTGLLIMSTAAIPQPQAATEAADIAEIKTIVESVATLADSQNFEALETLYADEIVVDYSSLSGEEAELMSPQRLMSDWAATLPGFDRTRHDITDIEVRVHGSKADATANVVADHFLGEQHWQVAGTYHYELRHTADRWLITAATFELLRESGSRDIFGPAMKAAAASPPSYVIRRQSAETVLAFLSALEAKDMESFAALWADEAVQDMPYSPKGHPKRVVGKAAITALYSSWPETTGQADFTSELVLHPMQNPETVYAEFKGRVDVLPTGRTYRQTYGSFFHIEKGKILLYREYYDPAAFAWAFDLAQLGAE